MPVHNSAGSLRGRNLPAAVLFVLDPERAPGDIESILREIFGLSITEAALAALLSVEGDLSHTCEQMRIRKSTARTHLQNIFRKMEITKQAQLASRVQQLAYLAHVPHVD
jgi:DNA-binding CsgD family transcriptional regulator